MKDTLNRLHTLFGERLKTDYELKPYTTLKIGGRADAFIEASGMDDLSNIINAARKEGVPVSILGGGSNLLVSDDGVRGLVVRNATGKISLRAIKGTVFSGSPLQEAYLDADSGVMMNRLIRFTIEEGLGGLEMHLGLPGTVGGAVCMNSKWTNPTGQVGDAVHQAWILRPDGKIETVSRSYFAFRYGYSRLQKTRDILLRVTFVLHKKNRDELWKRANDSIAYRRKTQPLGVRSPGCTFKNIPLSVALSLPTPNNTTSAGFLIDHAGLKGASVGGARVSDIHANFIVNTGSATARDVIQLIDIIKQKVKEQYLVELEEEIIRFGDFSG